MEEVNKVFTEQEKAIRRLQGFAGIVPGRIKRHTPQVFKDAYPDKPELWPVYDIEPPSGLDLNDAIDDTTLYDIDPKTGIARTKGGKWRTQRVRKHVKDWRNHREKYPDGNIIPCEKDENGLTDKSLRTISAELMEDLLKAIAESEEPTVEEGEGLKS